MDDKIIVYTKNNCKYCQIVKNFLDDKGIKYETRNIEDPDHPEYAEQHAKLGYNAAPLTRIKGETVVGFDLRHFNRLLG